MGFWPRNLNTMNKGQKVRVSEGCSAVHQETKTRLANLEGEIHSYTGGPEYNVYFKDLNATVPMHYTELVPLELEGLEKLSLIRVVLKASEGMEVTVTTFDCISESSSLFHLVPEGMENTRDNQLIVHKLDFRRNMFQAEDIGISWLDFWTVPSLVKQDRLKVLNSVSDHLDKRTEDLNAMKRAIYMQLGKEGVQDA